MKFIIRMTIIVVICIVFVGCASDKEEVIVNRIYPMELEDNEKELLKLLVGPNSTALLSTTLNEDYGNVRIFVESYADGELVGVQEGLNLELNDRFDIAIISREIGNWSLNASVGDAKVSAEFDLAEKFLLDDNILRASSYLSYEVDVQLNEPQIIGVFYFDEPDSIVHKVSVFENNEIENMWRYKYLYIMKIIFE